MADIHTAAICHAPAEKGILEDTLMDNRPIGFFDSGLGGLTCIAPLMRALPNERIIYFGDTARTPYGSETIRGFARQIAAFLIQQNVKMIVIACNTVTATCLRDLQQRFPQLPIMGVIQPAANRIGDTCNETNRIGIIGTKATIKSKSYEALIHQKNPALQLYSAACPALVPLIEEGIIENEIMDLTIRYYMDHFISYYKLDTLVLGCTHYPLILDNFRRLYPSLRIVNPSEEVAGRIQQVLDNENLLAGQPQTDHTFYASDLSENFVHMINRIFQLTEFRVAFKSFDLPSA